ncbi:MAG: C40 family peptidase [Prevotellaceae bacterium]|jgi:cell wall-associated NlpC family hydrolase|nr:C40 family peptidase [Prevotellaceae bacterium]
MKKTILLLTFLLLLAGTSMPISAQEDSKIVQLKELSNTVKQNHAPDRRSRLFEVTFKANAAEEGVVYVVKGVTTEVDAKEALLAAAANEGITLVDSVKLLPDSALGDKIFGITSLGTTFVRSSPSHSAEMDTQTLMGMPLRILEKRGTWARVVTPEGYISWMHIGAELMTKEEVAEWNKADKVVITTHYTLFRAQPEPSAAVVREGVWGCIAKADGEEGDYFKVRLPDGKSAYVPKTDAQKFEEWLNQRDPNAQNLIATGKQFVGFPYMWGGTSTKGVDCSGFVKSCFYLNGVIIPRDASQQVRAGEEVDISNIVENLQPADLVFFGSKAKDDAPERITHVGMYIGNGRFIHSNGTWASVTIESLLPDQPDYTKTAESLIRVKRYIHLIDKDKDIVSISKHPWYT